MTINNIQLYFQDVALKQIAFDILDTDEPNKIEQLVKRIIFIHCKSKIQEVLFIKASIGIVFGILLSSGKNIILKIYNKNISLIYLKKMNYIQEKFNLENFPAPKVLS